MAAALTVRDVEVHFHTRRGVYKALNGVDLTLRSGEVLGIAGESGCGKTTLGLTVMGLLARNAAVPNGEVVVDNIELLGLLTSYALEAGENFDPRKNDRILRRTNKALAALRGVKLSMVFQEPMTSLNPVLQIGFQVAESIYFHNPALLASRALARTRATPADLREMVQLLRQAPGEEDAIAAYAKEHGLAGMAEQVLFVWRRGDIHTAKKEKMILSLGGEELSIIPRKVLETIERTGDIPLVYRRAPIVSKVVRRILFKEGYRKAEEILTTLGIPRPERVVRMYPHELSGGMRQRVVIAIALANNPGVVILDEPTSAVDVTVQAQILEMIKKIREEVRSSFVFISHDLSVLAQVCDRIAIMYAGKIVEIGPTSAVLNAPLHPYTQMLISAVPTLEGKEVAGIVGEIPDMRAIPTGCAFHPRCPHVMEKCKLKVPPDIRQGADQVVACYLYGDA